nr:N4-gp56 family major capsid protein [Bacillus cereus]
MPTTTQTTGLNGVAGSVNTGSGAASTIPLAFYEKALLKMLQTQTEFTHNQLAKKTDIPKGNGTTVNFRRIVKLTPKLDANGMPIPLTEGVTPDGLNASVTAITASTLPYGDYVLFSDMVDWAQPDPIVAAYLKETVRIVNEKLDIVCRETLNAGTNVFYENKKTSTATLAAGDIPTLDSFRKVVLSMKKNFVRPAKAGDYVAMISPAVAFDLLDDPKFQKILQYGNDNKPLLNGEIGRAYGVRFVEVINAKTKDGKGTGGVNVHCSIVVGEEAYGDVKVAGNGNVKPIMKPLGSAGANDPLDQRQSVGAKCSAYTSVILNQYAVARVESVPTNA